MRALSVLLLCVCVCVLGVSGQYVTDGTGTSFTEWKFSAPAAVAGTGNPVLNLTAGNTYTFDVTATSSLHPFAFSASGPTNTPATTTIDPALFNVTANGCSGTGGSGDGYKGTTSCIVSIQIAASAAGQTIYYKCTSHGPMTGTINVVAAAATTATPTTVAPTTVAPTTVAPTTVAPTTVAPTNGSTTAPPTNGSTTAPPTSGGATTAAPTTNAPTTVAPTQAPTTGGTITANAFHITGNTGTTAWVFTDNGVQYVNPTLKVTAGSAVTFSFEYSNSQYHPFSFSSKSNTNEVLPTQDYFPDTLNGFTVTTTTTCDTTYGASVNSTIKTVHVNATTFATNSPCVITYQTQQADAGATVYYRCVKHAAMIGTINVVGSGSSSSTGGNSASTVAGAGLALVVAVMAALMA